MKRGEVSRAVFRSRNTTGEGVGWCGWGGEGGRVTASSAETYPSSDSL